MASNVEIWNLLNKVKLSAVTQSQLNEMTSRVAVDPDAIEFWSGMITVARAIGESRTFAHGWPIYNTGAVGGVEIQAGADQTYTPTGTEVWRVQAFDLQGCVGALIDGDGNGCLLVGADTADKWHGPIYLSSSMSISFNNTTGAPATPKFSYHKVSL